MKNVRLFAVAAAMGMFASAVSAAEVKPTYTATWDIAEEIIKVDVGHNVVAPAATVKVVKETRTADIEEVDAAGLLQIPNALTCYNGWTDVEAEDENGDTWVDDEMLFAAHAGWISNDVKFFPSAKTALYYLGWTDGSSVTGGRFLAPGQAEKEFYASDLKHVQFEDLDAVAEWLVSEGKITYNYDEEEELTSITINTLSLTNEHDKPVATYSLVLTPTDSLRPSKYEKIFTEAAVSAYVNGVTSTEWDDEFGDLLNVVTLRMDNYQNYTTSLEYFYVDEDGNEQPMTDDEFYIVDVNEKKGIYTIDGTIATASDAKGRTLEPVEGKINLIVLNEDEDITSYSRFTTISIAKGNKYDFITKKVWDDENAEFVSKLVAPSVVVVDGDGKDEDAIDGYWWNNLNDADVTDGNESREVPVLTEDLDVYAGSMGLLFAETPENTSDKIVIWANDLIAGNPLITAEVNVKKETITYVVKNDLDPTNAAKNVKFTVGAVKLDDGVWYPAVDTEEELATAVSLFAGLRTKTGYVDDHNENGYVDATDYTATESGEFGPWLIGTYKYYAMNPISGFTAPKGRELQDGTTEELYWPTTSYQHYAGTYCTYKLAGSEEVAATITTGTVDTTSSGVKELTYTAKVGDEVVAETSIKVVVAPKYTRVYQGGKVVKLTAYYLDGTTPYAVYNYDWAAKTYTATFYAADGVTVASTANGTL